MESFSKDNYSAMAVIDSHCDTIIFGLGSTGLSVAKFLARQGEDFVLVDTRELPPNLAVVDELFPDCEKYFGTTERPDLTGFQRLIISPGISRDEEIIRAALNAGLEVLGDIELFYRNAQAPIIAVTGSNGKSTVVTLITQILKEAGLKVLCGGNIGIPALDLLSHPRPDYYVLEVSSFQLESVSKFAAKVAVILNLSPDHLDRYESYDDYVQAKINITRNAEYVVTHEDDVGLVGNIDPITRCSFSAAKVSAAKYKIVSGVNGDFLSDGSEKRIPISSVKIRGSHNHENALAALAVTDFLGISADHQMRALENFDGLAHRSELVGVWQDVIWINDSKGTNVGATAAALNGCLRENNGILIAGGVGKGADFSPLKQAVAGRVKDAILFGEDAAIIAECLKETTTVHRVDDLSSAVNLAKSLASHGDTVLLSPACASFDMFDNYEHRGDCFKALVVEVNNR